MKYVDDSNEDFVQAGERMTELSLYRMGLVDEFFDKWKMGMLKIVIEYLSIWWNIHWMKDDSCELIELSNYFSKKETVKIDRNKFILNEMKMFSFWKSGC